MKRKYFELIEQYFNGEMTPDEISAFEKELEKDPELGKAFREYQQILEALKDTETLELRAKLKKIREGKMKPGSRKRFMDLNNNWIWMAALLTIAVSFTIVLSLMVYNVRHHDRRTVATGNIKGGITPGLNAELMKYGMRTHGMKLVHPADTSSMIVRGDLLFEWTVDSTYNLLLDVMNSDGKIVFKSRRHLTSPYLFTKDLKEGFYIFRFRDNKETFSLSMFYMR